MCVNVFDSDSTDEQKVGSSAHELFHAYQHENNEDLNTVNAEDGAYIFGEGIKFSLGFGSTTLGNETKAGEEYEKATFALIGGQFSSIYG